MNITAIKYGILSATIMVVGGLLPFWIFGVDFDYDFGEIAGYTTILIAMGTIFFAIKNYRTNQEDRLSFKEGMVFGTYINFVASLLFGIFSFVIYQWLYPEFLQSYLDQHIMQVRNSGESIELINSQLAEIEADKDFYLSPVAGGFLMFITVFPIGLVITSISSYLLKSKS